MLKRNLCSHHLPWVLEFNYMNCICDSTPRPPFMVHRIWLPVPCAGSLPPHISAQQPFFSFLMERPLGRAHTIWTACAIWIWMYGVDCGKHMDGCQSKSYCATAVLQQRHLCVSSSNTYTCVSLMLSKYKLQIFTTFSYLCRYAAKLLGSGGSYSCWKSLERTYVIHMLSMHVAESHNVWCILHHLLVTMTSNQMDEHFNKNSIKLYLYYTEFHVWIHYPNNRMWC